ncbi:hypothetical protein [Paraburkholderia tuberum]|uniref:hypothetical protein n=1 Tax=Paraburkholderia tuberum TaxID=157910 RepID=UPI001FC92AE9|nr:hypothetical protein [Paraburkholderia tuberum]
METRDPSFGRFVQQLDVASFEPHSTCPVKKRLCIVDRKAQILGADAHQLFRRSKLPERQRGFGARAKHDVHVLRRIAQQTRDHRQHRFRGHTIDVIEYEENAAAASGNAIQQHRNDCSDRRQ